MKPSYRQMRKEDIPSLLEISSLQLGPSYLNKSTLTQLLNDPDTHIEVLLVSDRIAGYSIIHIIEKSYLQDFIGSGEISLPNSTPTARIQLRKTTAIHPDYTGRGLGTAFIRHTMNLYDKECDYIMSINWKRSSDIPMEKISTKLGMKQLVEIKNYWKEDSLKSDYDCPECRKPPCTCSAVIYIKKTEK